MNWVWGWNNINRSRSSAVITWSSITLEPPEVNRFLQCLWWIVWLLLKHDHPKDLIIALDKSIFLHRSFHSRSGGMECFYAQFIPWGRRFGEKIHIWSRSHVELLQIAYIFFVFYCTIFPPGAISTIKQREKVQGFSNRLLYLVSIC